MKTSKYILWFKDIKYQDVPLVGGKNASLGEMFSKLTKKGVNVPDGFALTTEAYWHYLKKNGFDKKLERIFQKFNPKSIKSLQKTGKLSRKLIMGGKIPHDLEEEIIDAYELLGKKYGKNPEVAVRTSGVAEDTASASFAGQFETYLNVSGKEKLLEAVKKSIASTFTDRAIAYREEKGFSHLKLGLSVGVQKMVRSDLASSGIIFTLDTESGFKNIVLINSIWGVGEMIVKGKITPDQFYVFKPTLKQGYKPIIIKNLGRKDRKYVFNKGGGLKETKVSPKEEMKFSLSDEEVLKLAHWAILIEEHYGKPQDIEWAKDGKTGNLFVVQSRPETVHASETGQFYEEYEIETKKQPIFTGIAIGNKIGKGKAKIIPEVSRIGEFKKGEILVTRMTDPDWVPIMRMASAIVTDEGGRTCFGGDTKILTDKGYLSISQITELFKKEDIKVLSLNRKTLQLEWKKVINGFQRKSQIIAINISQTGRMKNNILKVTPDHKFLSFKNRELISKEIIKLLKNKEYILSLQSIPSLQKKEENLTPALSYLLGGLTTDGHIYLNANHGEVQLIQKNIPVKFKFIEKMNDCLKTLFNYSFHHSVGKMAGRRIRGKLMKGIADRYRCYSKEIAVYLKEKQNELSKDLLFASEDVLYNFLAGVIDGDGTYNKRQNRINIFCSKENLFEAISISCLRLGITFQVNKNRNIYNIQIVDKIREIFKYTSRVGGDYNRLKFGTRFFAAKQLLGDIINKVNYKGRIKAYLNNNCLIDIEKIRNYVIPLIRGQVENHELTEIINSSLRMLRVNFEKNLGIDNVYNIEVEDNHNYVVFTSRGTPVLVENCHAAIVSRELGIPAIVGAKNASKILKTGNVVTVDCSAGQGRVFLGDIPFKIKRYDLKRLPKLKTKIMVNIGAPDISFKTSFLPQEGVGLARIEFILAEKIRIHPLALIHYAQIKDRRIKSEIDKLTLGYKNKKQYFVDKLAEGVSQIAAAFYPKPVIVRFSDFKSNEYAQLVGGNLFEPKEANPMLGWRGASRYYDEKFKPAFLMEVEAIKKTREVFGLKNVQVMVPFCRTLEEGRKVLKLIKKNGLGKGRDGLKVIVMCEIPSNVILAEKFLDIFDGMSIGSNDLTQLVLGLDRDSALVSKSGDERNEAVKKMVKEVIEICKKRKKYIGICGQAPSDYLEFAEFLIKEGIDSISLNPDTVVKTIMKISKKKKQ